MLLFCFCCTNRLHLYRMQQFLIPKSRISAFGALLLFRRQESASIGMFLGLWNQGGFVKPIELNLLGETGGSVTFESFLCDLLFILYYSISTIKNLISTTASNFGTCF